MPVGWSNGISSHPLSGALAHPLHGRRSIIEVMCWPPDLNDAYIVAPLTSQS